MKKKLNKKILLFLIILIVLFIFCLSNAPAKKSGSDSSNIIRSTIKTGISITNKIGLTDYHPTDMDIKNITKKINEPLRECMHAIMYFVLALILIIFLNTCNFKRIYLVAIITCLFYAITDEFHQIFVEGRSWEFIDLLLDSLGIFIACILFKIINELAIIRKKI